MKVDARFLTAEGPEIFTGNELLLKGALEATGGMHLLGGYPGSPAAQIFDAMSAIRDLLAEKGIRALMNSNEALAAAMLNGSQTLPCRAMIAMKSVGVHVAADALALGNLAGAHREGGAIIVYGDDPWSDSTQVPADSRYISKHLFIPTVEPSGPQEIKDFVDLSLRLSRESELYIGQIITTNLLDGGGSVQCRPNQYPELNSNNRIDLDTALIDVDRRVLLPPKTWWQEESLPVRLRRAAESARRLGLNVIQYEARRRRPLGFVSTGLAHAYLLQSLAEMGLLGEYPVLKLGLSYPVDAEMIRRLAQQCERIIVVEERRGFVEEQIVEIIAKDRQNGLESGSVEVWGKQFPEPLKGFPTTRGLHPSIIISRLAPLVRMLGGRELLASSGDDSLQRELGTIDGTGEADADLGSLPPRIPTFCPGCPHRDSAAVCLEVQKRFRDESYMARAHKRKPTDLIFHGDTGCYTMLMFPPNTSLMHDYSGMGLGGGTGAGTDPFVTNKEVVFMGDSTFFHSGQLAISQAVKLGQDITFIILDNSTTAMTGHQPVPNVGYDIVGDPTPTQDIEEIVWAYAGDGPLTVVRADPQDKIKYARLLERTFLADGVKVIIADKECGITRIRRKKRRERDLARKLGYLPRWQHMNVNQDVCRFCLSCAEMTGCPGLRHAATDYGPKMDTDLTWCVDDGACERVGACQAFEQVTIKRKRPPRSKLPELRLEEIPEPAKRPHDDVWRCCLTGVGGMGIGLATQILVRAGHKEGYEVLFLDKKGLAIRNGGVTSQVVYNVSSTPLTAVIPFGKADLLIGMDVLEAARALEPAGRMRIASRDRTAAVINTDKIETIGALMTGRDTFDPAELEDVIRRHTRSDDFLARNLSRICEKYLGSKLYANIMMLGFAFQKGLVPVSMHSMAWAIKDTIRSDFRKNLYAFNMGRKLVVSPELFQGAPRRTDWREVLEDKCRFVIRRYGRLGSGKAESLRKLATAAVEAMALLSDDLKRDVVVRAYDCFRWGGLAYAQLYADKVMQTYKRESAVTQPGADLPATRSVAHDLASAMLIKDAVYVAELSTSPDKYARDREKYNVNSANGDRIRYRHLWHVDVKVGTWRRHMRLSPPHGLLRLLRHWRWLRKLPRWQRGRQAYLQQYLKAVDAFAPASLEACRRDMAALASPLCMNCMNPRCQDTGCPLHASVPAWVDLANRGQWQAAAQKLLADNPFPEFTSRICPAPCQQACKLSLAGNPVSVRQIEHQIIEQAFANGWVGSSRAAASGQKVAIVGSGPAGLAAAHWLWAAGHAVTIFEKEPQAGGLLRTGIPAERLPKELIDRRLELMRRGGVEFRTGVQVGYDVPATRLGRDFGAILVATGATRPRDLKVAGRDSRGISFALDFLRSSIDCGGKRVVVIGGGETGNDCVETALGRGAAQVTQLEILPAPCGSQAQAHEGRLCRQWSTMTKRFIANDDGQVIGVRCAPVRWHSTTSGKAPREIGGAESDLPADVVVLAVGFDPVLDVQLAEQLGLEVDGRNKPLVDNFASSVPGVFIAGDLATGAHLVAGALHTGRKAAGRINEYLSRLSASRAAAAAATADAPAEDAAHSA